MTQKRSALLVAVLLVAGCTAPPGSESQATSTFVNIDSTTLVSIPEVTTTTPSVDPGSGVSRIDIGPLEPRGGHSVIWTGEEMIVWGGEGNETGSVLYADGAAYDPATDSWHEIADAPIAARRYHVAVWTGIEMLVVGGVGETDGAKYAPATDTWDLISESPIPLGPRPGASSEGLIGSVWTGDELVVWHVGTDQVAAYDPEVDEWTLFPSTGLPVDNGALRWNGDHIYAFGTQLALYPANAELLAFVLDDGLWQSVSSVGFSTPEYNVEARPTLTQWTSGRFVAWSGSGHEALTWSFDPAAGVWTQTARNPDPPCEGQGEPIQAGDSIISFGWCGPTASILDAETDTWTPFAVAGYPTARYTVWTGTEIVNWGDTCCYGNLGQPFSVDAWRVTPPR